MTALKSKTSARTRPNSPEDVNLEDASFFRAARRTQLRTRMRDEEAARLGLRTDEWRLLLALFEFGPMASIRLSEMTFMDRAAVSRTVARLEAAKHVFRVADANDGRIAIVKTTDTGHRLGHEISTIMRRREYHLMQVLTDQEYEDWLRITDKLDARLAEIVEAKASG